VTKPVAINTLLTLLYSKWFMARWWADDSVYRSGVSSVRHHSCHYLPALKCLI